MIAARSRATNPLSALWKQGPAPSFCYPCCLANDKTKRSTRSFCAGGTSMHASQILRFLRPLAFALPMVMLLGPAKADLNPAALAYKLPNQIEWQDTPFGPKMAVMRGDPDKPGPYIVLIKWGPHQMSRPHFHPNDRFITALSATCSVGTGSKFDPERTVPMPARYVLPHFSNQDAF